jgi:hypothetical protein
MAYPFVYSWYSRTADVAIRLPEGGFDEFFVKCSKGVFQGDVWGTVVACCLLLDFQLQLEEHLIAEGLPAGQIAIADDLTVICQPKALAKVWAFMAKWAPAKDSGVAAPEQYSLMMKQSKTKLFSFAPLSVLLEWAKKAGIPPEVERVSGDSVGKGVRFLGSPVGHPEFCRLFCLAEVAGFEKRLKAFERMRDKQSAVVLLRFCHVTRANFFLRTTPPVFTKPAAKAMRKGTMKALASILGVPGFTVKEWAQASLPITMGGLGLTDPNVTVKVAYASSLALCLHPLAKLEKDFWPVGLGLTGLFTGLAAVADEDWDAADGDDTWEAFSPAQRTMLCALATAKAYYTVAQDDIEKMRPLYMQKPQPAKPKPTPKKKAKGEKEQVAPPLQQEAFVFPYMGTLIAHTVPQLQKAATRAMAKSIFYCLMMDEGDSPYLLSEVGQRRLLSASGPGAGAWLTVLPARPDFRMENCDFVDAVRYRLGIVPVCMEFMRDQSMLCMCGKWHDPADPAQMMCCKRAGGGSNVHRHNVTRNKLAQLARKSGFSVLVEEVTVRKKSGERLRTDVSILDYQKWKKAQIDVKVTDPTMPSMLDKRLVQGSAAATAAQRKVTESKTKFPNLDAQHDLFLPAIVETYGLMHTDLRKTLRTLAEKQLIQSDPDRSFSPEFQSILLGVVVNELYQEVSVAATRGVVVSLRRAADKIRIHNERRFSGPVVTNARAEEKIGRALQNASRGFSSFDD